MRGYGQKDPLVEYKKESYDLFTALQQRIDEESLRYLFFLQAVQGSARRFRFPRTMTKRKWRKRKSMSRLSRSGPRPSLRSRISRATFSARRNESSPSCSSSAATALRTARSRPSTATKSAATIPVLVAAGRNTRNVMAKPHRAVILSSFLLLAATAQAGIWPEQFGPGKRTAVSGANVTNQKLWSEYGLQESEKASYASDTEPFTATAYRLQDSTAALAAFQWQRPKDAKPSALGKLAAETADGLTIAHGNYLLVFQGTKPLISDLERLYQSLPKLDEGPLPALTGYLPSQDLVPNSERYVTGPVGLATFYPGVEAGDGRLPPGLGSPNRNVPVGRRGDQAGDLFLPHSEPRPRASGGDGEAALGDRQAQRTAGRRHPVGSQCRRRRANSLPSEVPGDRLLEPVRALPQGQHRRPCHQCFHPDRRTAGLFHRRRPGLWGATGAGRGAAGRKIPMR